MTLRKNRSKTNSTSSFSLVSQFDDLMRKSKVLQSGCEAEFKAFALNQDEARKKWLDAEQRTESLEDKIKRLEKQASTLETQLKHARMQAEYELQGRKTAEKEKEDLIIAMNSQDHVMSVIRDLLNDKNSKSILHENDRERLAAFTNSQRRSTFLEQSNNARLNTIMERSASFLSDVSYDKTEEDLLNESRLRSGKKWKRPSAPPDEEEEGNTPPKRHRDEHNGSIVTATVTIDAAGKPSASVETSIPKLNKSFSEPSLDKRHESDHDSDEEVFRERRNTNYNNINFNAKPRKSILKSTPETPALRKASSAGRGLNRVHIFISKTVIRPETCVPCGKRIRFSKLAMRCKECRAVCHPECKDKLPLPCIPSCPSTPGPNKHNEGTIADFAPVERPMIPRLIVNCANEVELRGLDEVGIYRVPGSDKDQRELKDKFLKGRYPNLSNIHDIHVVCGCLKVFLRELKEPLVTFTLWPQFVATNDLPRDKCQEQLCNLVMSLPQANQDTLAFLIQHLQTVSSAVQTKMPLSNLAKVFGPTVVGYSTSDPGPGEIMSETQKQNRVMEHLLEIPTQFWADLLNVDEISLFPAGTPYTPDSVHAAPRSMLGPLNTPDMPDHYAQEISARNMTTTPSKENQEDDIKNCYLTRFAVKTREPVKPSRFFSSPLVH